jgi:hypothetical protein
MAQYSECALPTLADVVNNKYITPSTVPEHKIALYHGVQYYKSAFFHTQNFIASRWGIITDGKLDIFPWLCVNTVYGPFIQLLQPPYSFRYSFEGCVGSCW